MKTWRSLLCWMSLVLFAAGCSKEATKATSTSTSSPSPEAIGADVFRGQPVVTASFS
jgi:hypothetical protein